MSDHVAAPVLLEHNEGISRIRFNRPDVLNAVNSAMARAFLAACQEVAAREQTRVVVLSGEGRSFMSGLDTRELLEAPELIDAGLIEPMHQGMELLGRLDVAVLGSIQGPIAGAGMSMALACDLVLAATNCRFNFACLPIDATCQLGASWHLPRLVGMHAALEIALLSESLTVQQALSLGLVNRVVRTEQLASETQCLAERLGRVTSPAKGQLKRLIRDSLTRPLCQQLDEEKQAFARCLRSREFREAASAYLEKHRPGADAV